MANESRLAVISGVPQGGGRQAAWTRAAPHAPEERGFRRRHSRVPHDSARLVRAAAEARTVLAEAAVAAAVAAERARTIAEVLDDALAGLGAAAPAPWPAQAVPRAATELDTKADLRLIDAISPREREVLALVSEGRTNKAIAAALFVSPNTVKTHVASLLTKLDADTRVQLATIAARQGLA